MYEEVTYVTTPRVAAYGYLKDSYDVFEQKMANFSKFTNLLIVYLGIVSGEKYKHKKYFKIFT